MSLDAYELGRLDGWYRREKRSEFLTDKEYTAGYVAGSQKFERVRAWVRAHPEQSRRLDSE